MLLFATASRGRLQVVETFVSFVRFVVVDRPRQSVPIQESQDCVNPTAARVLALAESNLSVIPHAEFQLPLLAGFFVHAPQFEHAEFRDLRTELYR